MRHVGSSPVILVGLLVILFGCQNREAKGPDETATNSYTNKRIQVVFSYHPDLTGVIAKNEGLARVLDPTGVDYQTIYMDTRRNPSEEFKLAAAVEARESIEQYDPDVLITFDDNALKYLVAPYFKDSDLPVVFAGIDWDASVYGVPFSNTTGIVSVDLALQLMEYLGTHADGDRIAWLGFDSLTSRKETEAYQEVLGLDITAHYVTTFEEWQAVFLSLQTDTDILIHSGSVINVDGWQEDEATAYVLENVQIPVGTVNRQSMFGSLYGLVKVLTEQGEWAANAALRILDGVASSDIPVAQTVQGRMIVNLDIAERLDVIVDPVLLRNAEIYSTIE